MQEKVWNIFIRQARLCERTISWCLLQSLKNDTAVAWLMRLQGQLIHCMYIVYVNLKMAVSFWDSSEYRAAPPLRHPPFVQQPIGWRHLNKMAQAAAAVVVVMSFALFVVPVTISFFCGTPVTAVDSAKHHGKTRGHHFQQRKRALPLNPPSSPHQWMDFRQSVCAFPPLSYGHGWHCFISASTHRATHGSKSYKIFIKPTVCDFCR